MQLNMQQVQYNDVNIKETWILNFGKVMRTGVDSKLDIMLKIEVS